jgi:hypothetical protein
MQAAKFDHRMGHRLIVRSPWSVVSRSYGNVSQMFLGDAPIIGLFKFNGQRTTDNWLYYHSPRTT